MSPNERMVFLTFVVLMAVNLLSTFVYLVGLDHLKASLRRAFKARQ